MSASSCVSVLLLHGLQNLLAGELVPRRRDDDGVLVMPRSRATAAASFSSEMEPVRLRMMAEAVSIWFV